MNIVKFSKENFNLGLNVFMSGGVLVFPTDTVYGLGGDPFSHTVVNRILSIKGRVGKPLPVLVDSVERLKGLVHLDKQLLLLMESVWPSQLTIVVPLKKSVPATLGSNAIGVRIPQDEALRAFIAHIGGYIIGTSANPTGAKPATTVEEAIRYFGASVDIYYDGGVRNAQPSTVIKISNSKVYILREGSYPLGWLRRVLSSLGFEVMR